MSPSRSHLAVDIGTSSLKAALLDDHGSPLGSTKVSFAGMSGADLGAWDPSVWDTAFRQALGTLKDGKKASSVTISGNGPTLVPLKKDGSLAGPALLWLQRRSPAEIPPDSFSYFLPAAGWFRETQPDLFEKTAVFVTCPGYLSYRLTGLASAACPGRDFSPFMWDSPQLSAWGFEASLFPDLLFTGDRIGGVSARAAEEFGLGRGVPVYAGGPDYMMAIIGSGAVRPGISCDRAGTSEGINYCSLRPVDSAFLRTLPHAVSGMYTVAGILSSTGRVFEWFRRITNQTSRNYEDILREIYALPLDAGSPRFFPSRHRGPIWDFDQGIFAGLQPDHTHVELGKGVVEAIAFGILDVVETLNKEGCTVASLRGTGGQYRNLHWNRMKADILGIPLEIPRVIDAELIGNLSAALVGEGVYADLAQAAEDLVQIDAVIEPEMDRHGRYRELYREYRAACDLIPGTGP